MTELPAHAGRVLAEVAGIAATPGSTTDRARALLAPLRLVIPYDAVFITLYDPQRRRQVPLAREGYDVRHRQRDSPDFVRELERASLAGAAVPLRLSDLPQPVENLAPWAHYVRLAGFRDGLGGGLFSADGRYLGLLSFNLAGARPPSDGTMALLHRLMPMIADAVDPMRDVAALASVVADAGAGVVLTGGEDTLPLPGLSGDPLLAAGSAVLAVVRARLAAGQLQTVFLCPGAEPVPPRRGAPSGADLVRVTALACPPQPPGHLRAVVLLSPPPDAHGLTRRELEVLGLLVEGWSNARVAAELVVTQRTVTAHVERILSKLEAQSRTMAAVRALRAGLYVPAELTTRQRSDRG